MAANGDETQSSPHAMDVLKGQKAQSTSDPDRANRTFASSHLPQITTSRCAGRLVIPF